MKDNQQEQLFTELTSLEQSAISGGEVNLTLSSDKYAAISSLRDNQSKVLPYTNDYVSSDTGAKFIGIKWTF